MWFSMWFLLTIVTFGIVGPFMINRLVKRRNGHFERMAELQELVMNQIGNIQKKGILDVNGTPTLPKHQATVRLRNATALSLSSILLLPTIYVLYLLTKDLQAHEQSERKFFSEITLVLPNFYTRLPADDSKINRRPWTKYFLLMVATLGFASVYWLYRIFNDYNSHFKMEWKTEDNLLTFLKNASS
jgi:hypothetical protein